MNQFVKGLVLHELKSLSALGANGDQKNEYFRIQLSVLNPYDNSGLAFGRFIMFCNT